MSKNAQKRIINKDIKELQKMDLASMGIYIDFNEENILDANAIIIGPEGTPYENGVLYFKIEFPKDYPFNPPKVYYISSSRNRIHPNLYVGRSKDNYLGKVCLSIINTWSGPKWTTVMHIGSVLLSIQSLLNENPLHNEPGLENEDGLRNDTYNKIVEYDTYSNLIYKNCFQIPENYKNFEEHIKNHITKNIDVIKKRLEDLSNLYPDKMRVSVNVYNLNVIIDYPKIKNLINNLNI
uniref:UBC core domain-containing protein n=1 Tax=viral metagenome TaxID=1070528 RepID=A0A6C0BUD5_9ZZZZ